MDVSMAVLFPFPCNWLLLSDKASEVSRIGELLPVEDTRLLGILHWEKIVEIQKVIQKDERVVKMQVGQGN